MQRICNVTWSLHNTFFGLMMSWCIWCLQAESLVSLGMPSLLLQRPGGQGPVMRNMCVLLLVNGGGAANRERPEKNRGVPPDPSQRSLESNRQQPQGNRQKRRETAGKQPEENTTSSPVHLDPSSSLWDSTGQGTVKEECATGVQALRRGQQSESATTQQANDQTAGAGDLGANGQPRGSHQKRETGPQPCNKQKAGGEHPDNNSKTCSRVAATFWHAPGRLPDVTRDCVSLRFVFGLTCLCLVGSVLSRSLGRVCLWFVFFGVLSVWSRLCECPWCFVCRVSDSQCVVVISTVP